MILQFLQVGWAWNVFDLLLVGVQLLEELLMALSGGGDVGALCLSRNVNKHTCNIL